ncbi:MAG: hypothetical protein IT374_13085 [Polyangiaceae bacterium]|nr:hypothetical protein [Polyangiaceae bacterium]
MRKLASTLLACAALIPSAAVTLLGPTLDTPRAHAGLAFAVSLRQLVKAADLVVDGTAEESTSLWEDVPGAGRRIVTYTRVSVTETAYGKPQKDVWVRTLGGVVDKIGQRVEGEATVAIGARALLFLKVRDDGTHSVAEMAQGHFHVSPETAHKLTPALAGVLRGKSPERPARELLAGKPLTAALELIRAEKKAVAK